MKGSKSIWANISSILKSPKSTRGAALAEYIVLLGIMTVVISSISIQIRLGVTEVAEEIQHAYSGGGTETLMGGEYSGEEPGMEHGGEDPGSKSIPDPTR